MKLGEPLSTHRDNSQGPRVFSQVSISLRSLTKCLILNFDINLYRHFSQYLITKDVKGNEGTCIGVCQHPLTNSDYQITSDMWLYRGYNGRLYNNGEKLVTFPPFTQGSLVFWCPVEHIDRTYLIRGYTGSCGLIFSTRRRSLTLRDLSLDPLVV